MRSLMASPVDARAGHRMKVKFTECTGHRTRYTVTVVLIEGWMLLDWVGLGWVRVDWVGRFGSTTPSCAQHSVLHTTIPPYHPLFASTAHDGRSDHDHRWRQRSWLRPWRLFHRDGGCPHLCLSRRHLSPQSISSTAVAHSRCSHPGFAGQCRPFFSEKC
jgi:hypothetical protein